MSAGRGRQRPCTVCRTGKAAFPGVDYCFACWPGGPVTPPPCLRCGSRLEYFVNGLRHRCHRDGHPGVDSCRNCLAWGATRKLKWLCKACTSWCRKYTAAGACALCGFPGVLDEGRVCRLCHKQGTVWRPPRRPMDLPAANRHGHQLFLADMFTRKGMHRAAPPKPPAVVPAVLGHPALRQVRLFDMARDLSWHGYRVAGLAERAGPGLTAAIDPIVAAHAKRYGWGADLTWRVRTGVRILLGFLDGPGAVITASDAVVLAGTGLPMNRSLDILAAAGMVEEDRIPAIQAWFTKQTTRLPEPMVTELRRWFDVMLHGSRTPSRRRPRTQITTRLHLAWAALPALSAWAAEGKSSLREISRADVRAILPPSGNPRSTLGQGLPVDLYGPARQENGLHRPDRPRQHRLPPAAAVAAARHPVRPRKRSPPPTRPERRSWPWSPSTACASGRSATCRSPTHATAGSTSVAGRSCWPAQPAPAWRPGWIIEPGTSRAPPTRTCSSPCAPRWAPARSVTAGSS